MVLVKTCFLTCYIGVIGKYKIKANKIINNLLPGSTSPFHSPVICTSISNIKRMCLMGSINVYGRVFKGPVEWVS